LDLFKAVDAQTFTVSKEIAELFTAITETFDKNKGLLAGKINDRDRKKVLDQLGQAASTFREGIYQNEFSGKKTLLSRDQLIHFCDVSLKYIDHTIRANKRDDGLYHAYNLMTAKADEIHINYLYEMLEGQVSVLSSGYLSSQEAIDVLTALRHSPIYTERQHSYMLYPDRQLPRFVDKNVIPADLAAKSKLIIQLLEDGNNKLVVKDSGGHIHFNGRFNNVNSARKVLQELKQTGYADLVERDTKRIEETFEQVFNHKSFTGRSGGMYGYEGLGSIYWHMVSKLLVAVSENYQKAVAQGESTQIINKLAELYYDVRAGIGFNKTPKDYGAFPTDPYSHTPGFAGAKQPGMTGQVKEELITRLVEMGILVDEGKIHFDPILLRKAEFLTKPAQFTYYDVRNQKQHVDLQASQLGFTYCQVPVIYTLGDGTKVTLSKRDGSRQEIKANVIDPQTSLQIFDKTGDVVRIDVAVKPRW